MNKKNMVKMGLSLGLVGALGVGATLAMLTDKTHDLTNTFALSTKGINIILDEEDVTNPPQRTQTGNNYGELLSGDVRKKDPTVTVEKDSLNANIFVKVTNLNGNALTYDVTNIGDGKQWLDVTADVDPAAPEGTKYYVYMSGQGKKEEGDTYSVVATSTNDQKLTPVFNEITVADFDNDTKPKLQNIVVRAAAVQADHVTDEEALAKAVELLNSVEQTTETE